MELHPIDTVKLRRRCLSKRAVKPKSDQKTSEQLAADVEEFLAQGRSIKVQSACVRNYEQKGLHVPMRGYSATQRLTAACASFGEQSFTVVDVATIADCSKEYAFADLQKKVDSGIVICLDRGRRGVFGTYKNNPDSKFFQKVIAAPMPPKAPPVDEVKLAIEAAATAATEPFTTSDIAAATGASIKKVQYIFGLMLDKKLIKRTGERRGVADFWVRV